METHWSPLTQLVASYMRLIRWFDCAATTRSARSAADIAPMTRRVGVRRHAKPRMYNSSNSWLCTRRGPMSNARGNSKCTFFYPVVDLCLWGANNDTWFRWDMGDNKEDAA